MDEVLTSFLILNRARRHLGRVSEGYMARVRHARRQLFFDGPYLFFFCVKNGGIKTRHIIEKEIKKENGFPILNVFWFGRKGDIYHHYG